MAFAMVCSGSNSGRLCHHDPLSSGKYISRVAAHTGGIVGLKANSDHQYLATGGMDKTVKIWDIQSSGGMKLTHSLNTHKAPAKVGPRSLTNGIVRNRSTLVLLVANMTKTK